MNENLNSGYGQAKAGAIPFTTGKTFFVAADGDANFQGIDGLFLPDKGGVARRYSTIAAALAACTAGNADQVALSPNFTTAPSAAEIISAEAKGVAMFVAGKKIGSAWFENRAAAALPATTAAPIFTVTGRVKILSIIGVVTTIIETQENNTKLIADPTVGADVDLCAVNDISADAVGTVYSITGTLGDAMVATTSGVGVYQAAPLLLEAGSIDLSCAATNTGAVKWRVLYEPVDPGASIIAA